MQRYILTTVIAAALAALSCGGQPPKPVAAPPAEDPRLPRAVAALSRLPPAAAAGAEAAIRAAPDRFFALLAEAEAESAAAGGLLRLVDKSRALPAGYEPAGLEPLDGYPIRVTKSGMKLSKAVIGAVLAMNEAAAADGVKLTFASAYRSYDYQDALFKRYAAAHGEAEASRFSARAGTSQHQLGTAFDMHPIEDAFADTPAGAWMAANAWRFGFSLSFPQGMEEVTGYIWESWHYRYVTKPGAVLEREWFGGVQQYLMEFLDAYGNGGD